MTAHPAGETVGARYRSVRLRLTELLRSIDEEQWALPVAACPGWRVHDVVGHLVGIVEDAFAGRLSGPPPPELTQDQVARHRDDDPGPLLDGWSAAGPQFEEALTALDRWPAFIDVLSHELDIRSALGDRSERRSDDVVHAGRLLAATIPAGLRLTVDGQLVETANEPVVASLAVTSFDLLRIRLGRRSLAQVLAMPWEGDPRPALDGLFVFGPATLDLAE